MMKARMNVAVLMVVGLVAGYVVIAHAGAGSGTLGDAVFYQCYLIEGFNPPQVDSLNIDDQFVEQPGRQGVRVGPARLLCTPAAAEPTSPNHQLQLAGFGEVDHLKCYEVIPTGDPPRVDVQVRDPFIDEVVRVRQSKFVCVGAYKCPGQQPGDPCPPEP
jgi:hypothetical protein